jgi:hypothetical protein
MIRIIKLPVLLVLLLGEVSVAQPLVEKMNSLDGTRMSYSERSICLNKFLDTATGYNRSLYKQWKRWDWFARQHLDENGNLVAYHEKNIQALQQLQRPVGTAAPSSPNSNTGAWFNVGHTGTNLNNGFSFQGRVNCFAFDPFNDAIVYAGTAGGGIWKSFDYGDSWFSISDNLPVLGISSMAVDPTNANTIYALSGEGMSANIYFHKGVGILKSTDGGISWQLLGPAVSLSDQVGGYKLLIHPSNHNIILASMSNGLWRSVDGGVNWETLLTGWQVNDMEFKPGDPNTLYFTVLQANFVGKMDLSSRLYNLTSINMPRVAPRVEIAVTPDNPNAVYALAGPSYSNPPGCPVGSVPVYNGLYYSGNNGASFNLRNNNVDIFGMCRDQSWYNNIIYVNPINENNVIIGGIRAYSSLDGGSTVSLINDPANSIHHDCHAIERNPLNGTIYLGNDGGIHRSTNNGFTWFASSGGLVNNEYYRLSGFQGNVNLIMGGTQDNGVFIRNSNSTVFNSPNILLDFMDNFIDFTNSNIMYACSQNGGLNISLNGGISFSPVNVPGGGGAWITPIVQLPSSSSATTLFYGSNAGVMRTNNGGGSWVNINGPNSADGLAIGTDGTNFSLYAFRGGQVQVCNNPVSGSPVWTILSTPNSTNISAIVVNPANKNEAWFTCSGYAANNKVYRTLDGGASWANLSLSMPNIPVYSIAFANNSNNPGGAVYIGTELGVFYTDDQLPDWVAYYNGLPMVPVTDLEVNYSNNRIYASSYGRGIWASDLYNSCANALTLSGTSVGNKYYQASTFIESFQFVPGSAGNDLRLQAGQQVILRPGFSARFGSRLHVGIRGCGTGVLSKPNAAATIADSLNTKNN